MLYCSAALFFHFTRNIIFSRRVSLFYTVVLPSRVLIVTDFALQVLNIIL